jgi:hypothetical protein
MIEECVISDKARIGRIGVNTSVGKYQRTMIRVIKIYKVRTLLEKVVFVHI